MEYIARLYYDAEHRPLEDAEPEDSLLASWQATRPSWGPVVSSQMKVVGLPPAERKVVEVRMAFRAESADDARGQLQDAVAVSGFGWPDAGWSLMPERVIEFLEA